MDDNQRLVEDAVERGALAALLLDWFRADDFTLLDVHPDLVAEEILKGIHQRIDDEVVRHQFENAVGDALRSASVGLMMTFDEESRAVRRLAVLARAVDSERGARAMREIVEAAVDQFPGESGLVSLPAYLVGILGAYRRSESITQYLTELWNRPAVFRLLGGKLMVALGRHDRTLFLQRLARFLDASAHPGYAWHGMPIYCQSILQETGRVVGWDVVLQAAVRLAEDQQRSIVSMVSPQTLEIESAFIEPRLVGAFLDAAFTAADVRQFEGWAPQVLSSGLAKWAPLKPPTPAVILRRDETIRVPIADKIKAHILRIKRPIDEAGSIARLRKMWLDDPELQPAF